MDIKEYFGCQQTQIFSMYGLKVSLHSQRQFKTHLLFLPGVAELKLDVIDPKILLQFLFPCIFHLTNAGW